MNINMTNQDAINFVTTIIQEYTRILDGSNPGLATALAHTANAAITQITGCLNNYDLILKAQVASQQPPVQEEVTTPESHASEVKTHIFDEALANATQPKAKGRKKKA